ncbi:MAG: arginase family protein [Actinomycetales bacterium]
MIDYMPSPAWLQPRVADVATLMRARRTDDLSDVDIALFGVPFDLGTAFTPGARFGPAAVREASRMARLVNSSTGVAPFELARVADVGDAPTNPFDLPGSVDLITGFVSRLRAAGALPIGVGGDNTMTLSILRGNHRGSPVGLVMFDAHVDFFDSFYGSSLNHAVPIRRAVEEGLLDPTRCIQIGVRGPVLAADDWEWGRHVGIRTVTMDEFEVLGRDGVTAAITETVRAQPFHLALEIDVLDPSEAPGTGFPEAGGLRMRDLQVLLRSLTGRPVASIDVSEINPLLDPTRTTMVNTLNAIFEVLCVAAAGRAHA